MGDEEVLVWKEWRWICDCREDVRLKNRWIGELVIRMGRQGEPGKETEKIQEGPISQIRNLGLRSPSPPVTA